MFQQLAAVPLSMSRGSSDLLRPRPHSWQLTHSAADLEERSTLETTGGGGRPCNPEAGTGPARCLRGSRAANSPSPGPLGKPATSKGGSWLPPQSFPLTSWASKERGDPRHVKRVGSRSSEHVKRALDSAPGSSCRRHSLTEPPFSQAFEHTASSRRTSFSITRWARQISQSAGGRSAKQASHWSEWHFFLFWFRLPGRTAPIKLAFRERRRELKTMGVGRKGMYLQWAS